MIEAVLKSGIHISTNSKLIFFCSLPKYFRLLQYLNNILNYILYHNLPFSYSESFIKLNAQSEN